MQRYDIDSLDNRDPELIDRLCRVILKPGRRYFRSRARGLDRIPTGPGLYVGNHSGGMMTVDSFLFFGEVYVARGMADMPYGLGHEVAIQVPGIHQVVVPLGAVRASHDNALRLFERGDKVMVYPGGDVDNQRPYRHRNRIVFGGRTGYIRLALRAGVPIIPVVCAGGHETLIILDDLRWAARLFRTGRWLRLNAMPVNLSIPWGLTVGPVFPFIPLPARILMEVLEPVHFDRTGDEAADDDAYVRRCADRVEGAMQATLDHLAAERRELGLRAKIRRLRP
jgi:1-acyl-sn-glycerol-3-phosphate acyltransferase